MALPVSVLTSSSDSASVTAKAAQKVTWVLSLLEELDTLPANYFKKLVGIDLWECRAGFGGNIYRVLCFMAGGPGDRVGRGIQEGLPAEASEP